jgi:hypothetical protein
MLSFTLLVVTTCRRGLELLLEDGRRHLLALDAVACLGERRLPGLLAGVESLHLLLQTDSGGMSFTINLGSIALFRLPVAIKPLHPPSSSTASSVTWADLEAALTQATKLSTLKPLKILKCHHYNHH